MTGVQTCALPICSARVRAALTQMQTALNGISASTDELNTLLDASTQIREDVYKRQALVQLGNSAVHGVEIGLHGIDVGRRPLQKQMCIRDRNMKLQMGVPDGCMLPKFAQISGMV